MTQVSARTVGRVLAILGLAGILFATLTPQAGPMPPLPTICIVCGELGGTDVTLNVILFIPFAAGLAVAGVRARRIVLACFALSLAIELLQIRVIAGRDSSLGDLLMNTIGGMVGAGLGATWRAWLTPAPRVAARLQIAMGVAWLIVVAITSWALRPSLPRERFYGQPLPQHRQFEPYTGALLDFRLNGMPLRNDTVPDDPRYAEPIRAGEATVQTTVTAPRVASTRVAAIARMANPTEEGFLLGQLGRDVLVRMRLHAADLALRVPPLVLRDGFGGDVRAGDTLRVEGGLTHGGREIFARRIALGAPLREVTMTFTPAMGWMLFVPFAVALRPALVWLGTLWLAGLALPLGFFGARAGEGTWRAALIAITFVAIAMAGVPAAVGLAPVGALEWGASLAGVALGWLIAPARWFDTRERA